MFNISPFFFTVWMVHGRYLVVNLDDADLVEEEIPVAGKLPGICWACKWALNKVKKAAGNNATAEVKIIILLLCDQIGFLKSLCRKFVKKNLSVLIEELSTTDDVRTICVNLKACKALFVSPGYLVLLMVYSSFFFFLFFLFVLQ
uniref:NK-lysin tandem duplicate 4 n=1 Tax=Myripristis murdjan TaxID=586833 RepID=A0A667WXD8_9TELE